MSQAEHAARLASVQFQVRELLALIEADDKRRLARHAEEKALTEQMVNSLQQSYEILKKEKKRLKTELQDALAKATAKSSSKRLATAAGKPATTAEQSVRDADVVDLQAKLIDLNNRLLDIDFEVKKVTAELNTISRPDEKELLSTKMVVLQDTKRILQFEIDALRSNIFRIETASKAEAEKLSAEETGYAALARIEEQMLKITTRVDRAKQQIYFPAAKGFRFSTGAGGVYMAAQDLFLSEISGRINIHVEKVTRPDGTNVARLSVSVEGASSNTRERADTSRRGGSNHSPLPAMASAPQPRISTVSQPAASPPPPYSVGGMSSGGGAVLEDLIAFAAGTVPSEGGASLGGTLSGDSPDVTGVTQDISSHGGSAAGSTTAAAPPDTLAHDSPDYDPLGVLNPRPATPPPPAAPVLPAVPAGWDRRVSSPALPSALDAPTFPQAASTEMPPGGPYVLGFAPALPRMGPVTTLPRTSVGGHVGSTGGGFPPRHPESHGHMHDEHQGSGHKKGDIMSGFLSSLSKRKDKLKDMISGGHNSPSQRNLNSSAGSSFSHGGTGSPVAVGGNLWASDGGMGDRGGSGSSGGFMSGKLGARMGKLKDGLGERMDKMKETVGGRMERVKEGLGPVQDRVKEGMGKVKDTLSESMQDGRGKLSKIAAAVTQKTPLGMPLGRTSVGSAAVVNDRAVSEVGSPNRTSADFTPADATHRRSSTLSSAGAPAGTPPHLQHSQPAATLPPQPIPSQHARRGSTESLGGVSAVSDAGGFPEPSGALLSSGGLESLHGSGEVNLSVAFEEFASQPTRKGLYMQLLGERVHVVGERGTKVPDMAIREFMLELEVAMTAVIEWTSVEGWQIPDAHPLDLTILQLDHKMRGNSIPLPRTMLKALLNMFLPGIVTRLLLDSMPPELGSYVLQSGEQLKLGGEFRVRGPALSTYMAPLVGPPLSSSKSYASDHAKKTVWMQQVAAAARARQLLGLTEQQAEVINQLFTGPHAMTDSPRPVSICELCRMVMQYSSTNLWSPLCNQWNKALQVLFDIHNVPASDRVSFTAFMEGPVARVVRKPVQVAFVMDQLQVHIDVDAGLNTLHDFFARLCKELHERARKGDDVAVPTEPLEVQLEGLKLWHAALSTSLRTFKSKFRAASCSLVVAADREVFQFGAENLSYDGPMRVRLPLELLLDPDHSFVVDVKLPGRDEYVSGMTNMLQEIMAGLSAVADNTPANSNGGVAPAEGSKQNAEADAKTAKHQSGAAAHAADQAAYLKQWQDAVGRAGADLLASGQRRTPGTTPRGTPRANAEGIIEEEEDDNESEAAGLQLPVLQNPVVGQLLFRKVAFALRLDEERLDELMQSANVNTASNNTPSAGLVGTLLGCYGDLFSASLDVGWRPDQRPEAEEGSTRPTCMLTVANNEVTRVMASLESLIFSSTVSPRLAVSVLNAVVNGIMLRFYNKRSYQVRFWQRLFKHLYEYLGRDALDALVCLSARLEVQKGPIEPSKMPGDVSKGVQTSKLRLSLQGDARPGMGHSGGGSGAASGAQAAVPGPGSNSVPVYLLNEVNLLTLLDSVKLLTSVPGHTDV